MTQPLSCDTLLIISEVFMEKFAQRLKELRLEKKTEAKDFAAYIGVSEETILNWESGKSVPKKNFVLVKIAIFFDESSDYIVGLSDKRKNRV